MKQFKTETVKTHIENPYLRVYVNTSEDMNRLKTFMETLSSVDHVNITENRAGTREHLIIYPMKTYFIEEVKQDVETNLSTYFQHK
ncbi:hypothetical protein [uncultured Parabacteroides sp.]|uniref:hypothetical protein n=1 Tax=uncultured Parabacteroides sp. TaxID=512312 RepID=UPI0025D31867|nr:hypothetical protein [uncultured Parabacteroides sp.]